MADKMAVMTGATLQQYASPQQVFDHPMNTFVASFVGSPAMSLVPPQRTVNGESVPLAGKGWHLPISAANARKVLISTQK